MDRDIAPLTSQALLARHPFFSASAPAEIRKLLSRTTVRRVASRRLVFQQDDSGSGLYGILSGRIAFTVDSPQGKKLTLNVLGPGEFFGEIALLDGKGRTASAQAMEATELLFIGRQEFLAFVRDRPEILFHVIALLCARLRRSTDYMADTAFLGLSRRLAKLLALAGAQRQAAGATVRISHAELASLLAVSRERVSRQLAMWSGAGIVGQLRGRITIRDPKALEHVVSDD
jgi:CRP/FNR family cyclic AMP-dependent transcriptional regulator